MYLSTSYKQNLFPFYNHVRKGKRKKQHNQSHTSKNMLKQKQKQKNTNTNTKVKKKDAITVFYQITSSIKHQQEKVREVSESRYPRSADYIYIYIYTLYKRKVHQTLGDRKDMAYPLFPVPCLSVCLQTFCRHPCFRGNCV